MTRKENIRKSLDAPQHGRAPGSGHVLIVDDELVIRSLLSEMLSEDGFTVATAEDGKRGLEYINEGAVDLVISDVHMPVMNGPELIAELRRIDPGLPVIVLNSIPDRDVADVRDDRASACVNKPFDLHEIRETITRLRSAIEAKIGTLPAHDPKPTSEHPSESDSD
jgi:CheY-like chemotaxis protein